MKNPNTTYYMIGKLYVKKKQAKVCGCIQSREAAKTCALALDDELDTSTVWFIVAEDEPPIFLSALRQEWDSLEQATIYNDGEDEDESILNYLWYSEILALIREARKRSPLKEGTI